MAQEEKFDFFANEQPVEPEVIPSVEQAQSLTPEQRSDPDTIDFLKDDEDFFANEMPVAEADEDALLDQNQTLIDSLIEKGSDRFFAEDVEDPFIIPRAVGAIAGSIGTPILANQFLPPTTPPPVRGLVTFGASLFGTGVGTVSPELGMQIAEDMAIIPQGTRAKLGLSMTDMQTVVQGELLLDAAFNTGFTVLRQVGKITGRFFTTGGVLTKEGREALGLADSAAEKFHINMLPVQIRDRKISRGFVSIFGHFPFTTGVLKKRARDVDKQAEVALKSLGPRIAPLARFSDLSAEVLKKSQNYFKAVGRKFNIGYARLHERAEQAGVRVIPRLTSQKTRQIIETVEKANQVFAKGQGKLKGDGGDITNRFVKFLRKNFIPLETVTRIEGKEVPLTILQESGEPFVKKLPDIPPNIAKQDLKQLDGLVSKIDEFMSTLDKTSNQDQFIRRMATQLKLAIKEDMIKNVTGKNMGEAQEIVQSFRALDEEFSLTMSQVFETATANRFGTVKRGGLQGRGVTREATRQPVDMLAKTILKLDSPQSVQELRTLVGKKTFTRVVAQVMNSAVEKSMKTVDGSGGALKAFNTEAFISELGIKKGFGDRRAAVSSMLEISNSPFKMKDLDVLVETLKKIEGTPIPDVATFVARRAILGGWKSALGSFMASAGTVTAITGNLGGVLLATTLFIGGSKFVARMVSKPETAKSFLKAMDETASTAVRRTNYIRAMRSAINDFRQEDPQNADSRLMEHFIETMGELDDLFFPDALDINKVFKKDSPEINLNDPNPPNPEIDISNEFGGDQTL